MLHQEILAIIQSMRQLLIEAILNLEAMYQLFIEVTAMLENVFH